MPTEIRLPPLGTATTATVERYYVEPGDTIQPGQPLALVVTDRFEWDIAATATGTINEIVAQPGKIVAVGAPLVRFADHVAEPAAVDRERIVRITPLARNIATIHQLDLAVITGSGHGGRIMRGDVLALVDPPAADTQAAFNSCFSLDLPTTATIAAPAPPEQATNGTPRLAATISRTDLPYALTAIDVDCNSIYNYVNDHRLRFARRGVGLEPWLCVVAAAVAGLGQHRLLNSAWSDDGIILRSRIHLRIVRGQCSVHVANAAELSLIGLGREIAVNSAMEAGDQPPTFTIVVAESAIWSEASGSPSAVLSIGRIVQRPVVVEAGSVDLVRIRPVAWLTLAYDARIVQHEQADAFLRDVQRRVEHFHPL